VTLSLMIGGSDLGPASVQRGINWNIHLL